MPEPARPRSGRRRAESIERRRAAILTMLAKAPEMPMSVREIHRHLYLQTDRALAISVIYEDMHDLARQGTVICIPVLDGGRAVVQYRLADHVCDKAGLPFPPLPV